MAETAANSNALLERQTELKAIEGAIADAVGGSGDVLTIEGSAGIGKSSLLDAACAHADANGVRVLRARGSESEREFGFGCVLQWLEHRLQSASAAEREQLLAGSASLAAPVLGLDEAPPGGEASFAALHGLYWLCANLCEDEPLLLALDDAHWADAASLRFAAYLAPRLEGASIALMLAWRSEEPGAEAAPLERLAVDSGARSLRPEPLGPSASARLVRRQLGAESSDELCAACHEACGGNPLLLTELTRELAAQADGGHPDPTTIERQSVPAVARLVHSRLSGIGTDAKSLAQAVVVLGDGCSVRNAAALAELEPDAARAAADALRATGILKPGEDIAFTHPLVRAAVNTMMRPGGRSARHRRAAQLLDARGAPAERIAQHLLATDPTGEARSVELLRDASRAASRRGAPEAAARYLRRALEEPPDADQRAEMLMELGVAGVSAQDPAAHRHLEDALRSASDPELQARCALLLTRMALYEAGGASGLAPAEQGLAVLDDPDSELSLSLEAEAIGALIYGSRPAKELAARVRQAEPRVEHAVSPAERAVLALTTFARLLNGTITAAETIARAERALADGRLLAEYGPESPMHTWAVNLLAAGLRPARALEHYEEGLAEASRRGSALGVAIYHSHRPMAHYARGDLVAAETDAAMPLDGPLAKPLPLGLAMLAAALVEQGRLADARSALEGIPLPDDGVSPDGQMLVSQLARGRLRIAAGELEDGVADILLVGEQFDSVGHVNVAEALPIGPWRPDAARGLLALGRTDEARELAERELEIARFLGSPAGLGIALSTVASLDGDADSVEVLRDAVETLERSENRLALARSLVDLGAATRRLGHRREAREPLRRGLDLAHRCGARPLVDRALEELRSAGARPRRPQLSGRDALTPQERRISEMASEGLTNREIAQALFLTLRTVEMHLSNAYRKLNISSRKELTEALMPPASSPAT